MSPAADVAANLDAVRRRIHAAAHRVGRTPSDITLIAVSKTFSVDAIRAAITAGHQAFGENRVQEAVTKQAELGDSSIEWHLIGHLQTNKVRKAVTTFAMIQSVDRPDLLARLDAAAADAGVRPRILLQVDLAGEATKHGADIEALTGLAHAAADARNVEFTGLMLIPPVPETPEASRPWFAQLRQVRDGLLEAGIPPPCLRDLSMGMSHDFDVAVEEGATIVRVGTLIFGARDYAAP